jgi:hypothetical protein
MNRAKSWIQKIIRNAAIVALTALVAVILFICLALVVAVPACPYLTGRTQKIFDTIQVGDTKESVISKMGTPSRVHPRDTCKGACVDRLWYDYALCLGLDEWSVDFDKNNRVVEKAHEISP